jgi:hypothetical protein
MLHGVYYQMKHIGNFSYTQQYVSFVQDIIVPLDYLYVCQ